MTKLNGGLGKNAEELYPPEEKVGHSFVPLDEATRQKLLEAVYPWFEYEKFQAQLLPYVAMQYKNKDKEDIQSWVDRTRSSLQISRKTSDLWFKGARKQIVLKLRFLLTMGVLREYGTPEQILDAIAGNSAMVAKSPESSIDKAAQKYDENKHVAMTKHNLRKILKKGVRILGDLDDLEYRKDQVVELRMKIDSGRTKKITLTFILTVKGKKPPFYSLTIDDFEKLLKFKGWRLREQLPKVGRFDIILSGKSFEKLIFNGKDIWRVFKKEVGLDKAEKGSDTVMTVKGRDIAISRKRTNNYRKEMVISGKDFRFLARQNKWRLSEIPNGGARYAYPNRYEGIEFASKLERDTAIVLRDLGKIGRIKPGVNFQVKVPQGSRKQEVKLDFKTKKAVFEPHWEPNGKRNGEYHQMRRDMLDRTKYKKRELFTFESISASHGLYDLLGLSPKKRLKLDDLRKEADFKTDWLKRMKFDKDHAMTAAEMGSGIENGGIDFTANKTPLEIKNTGGSIKFHLDPAMFQQLKNATGFVPVITSVQPLKDIALFLGISAEPSRIQ